MLNRQSLFLPAAARVMLASLFLVSGFGKLAAPAATKAYIVSAGLPLPDVAYLIALAVEVGLGVLLLLGYRTRVVAAVMAVFTLVTAFTFHTDLTNSVQLVQFMKNIAITGGLLHVVAYEVGKFSLDAVRLRGRQAN